MSAKDLSDVQQKLFYIDRRVNPYFNVQIMKLYQLNNNLTAKVKELENKLNALSGQEVEQKPKDKKKAKNVKIDNNLVMNDIRTINLE